ncbi:hypothetical protein O181_103465, partial [Austropuccinia psidii MF-1]|nr:hypothetical protein [Austropuccinia psidii MF-1]
MKFRLLGERAARIRENQATVQAIEKQLAEPDRAYSDSLMLTRSRPTHLSSGFTAFRYQKISGQESPLFTIPCSFQEKTRIQGQNQEFFQPKAERVRTNDPEAVRLGERSTQKPEIVVNTYRISSLNNRNITPTQNEHSVVTPERIIIPDTNSRTTRACNQSFNLDEIANTIKDVRKRNKIGKHFTYRSSSFKEKQPFWVDFKDKPKERVSEVTKEKNSCSN